MRKILIADDSLFMRQMLKEILPKDLFEIVGEASTGKEAVEQYKALKPDLVTMDITMPDMDGITAVAKIKELDSKAKIVMVSAMGQKPMVKGALEAGASDFIVKPFDKDRIINTLSNL